MWKTFNMEMPTNEINIKNIFLKCLLLHICTKCGECLNMEIKCICYECGKSFTMENGYKWTRCLKNRSILETTCMAKSEVICLCML